MTERSGVPLAVEQCLLAGLSLATSLWIGVRKEKYLKSAQQEWIISVVLAALAVLSIVFSRSNSFNVWWKNRQRTCNDSGLVYGALLMPLTSVLFLSSVASQRLVILMTCCILVEFLTKLPTRAFALSIGNVLQIVTLSGSLLMMIEGNNCISVSGVKELMHISFAVTISFWLLSIWQDSFPKSFTIGEIMVVAQVVTISITAVFDFFFLTSDIIIEIGPSGVDMWFTCLLILVSTLGFGLLEMVVLPRTFYPIVMNVQKFEKYDQVSLRFLPLGLFFVSLLLWYFLTVITPFYIMFEKNFVVFLIEYIFMNMNHLRIGFSWLGILIITLPIIDRINFWLRIIPKVSPTERQTTTYLTSKMKLIYVRKLYHFLALILFAPAQFFDAEFMLLGYSIALALLIIAEYIRLSRFYMVGPFLDRYLKSFVDYKDEGPLVLTHLYLLLGCFYPLALAHYSTEEARLISYSGLLLLGIGDACGAIIGATFGRYRLPGVSKTVEGTLTTFITTFSSYLVVAYFIVSSISAEMMLVIFLSAVVISIFEAFTDQIDNLLLPIVYPVILKLAFNTQRSFNI